MSDIIRHPRVTDVYNANAHSRWASNYYGGVYCPDLRDDYLRQRGRWIELQMRWRLNALRLRKRLEKARGDAA